MLLGLVTVSYTVMGAITFRLNQVVRDISAFGIRLI